jgi:hypothetical protein
LKIESYQTSHCSGGGYNYFNYCVVFDSVFVLLSLTKTNQNGRKTEMSIFQKQSNLHNKATSLGAIAILLAFVLGCEPNKNLNINSTSQTATPKQMPTETNANTASQQTAPNPTAIVSAYNSGGLGLDRATWDSSQGIGKPDVATGSMYYIYGDSKFYVQFYPLESGNVGNIERTGGDSKAIPLEDARKESKNFIPADAKFVRTYMASSGSTVDLYKSESLKSRFPDSQFYKGKPGDFIIIYRNQTGKTTSFIVATGNNP